MPSLDDVYCKFGFASEAAQLLETELGNVLLKSGAVDAGLIENPDPAKAVELLTYINKQTLGQLLKSLNRSPDYIALLESQLIPDSQSTESTVALVFSRAQFP